MKGRGDWLYAGSGINQLYKNKAVEENTLRHREFIFQIIVKRKRGNNIVITRFKFLKSINSVGYRPRFNRESCFSENSSAI